MTRDLPPTSWRRQPWKNGGGVTYEIVRWPDTDDYDVRVSVADVERDGPFSTFPGYSRVSYLLGAPIEFAVPGPYPMSKIGDVRMFDGAMAVSVRLPSGPTRLLNILARNPGPIVRCGTMVPEQPVRFAFALDDDGDLPRGHARVFDPPGRIEQPVLWIE